MRINFYSPVQYEPWDWRSIERGGIGGSETSHIEMATRLAARGHEVESYTRLPPDAASGAEQAGVAWRDLEDADLSDPGVWVMYRHPASAPRFSLSGRYWLVCQDVFYKDWRSCDAARFERILGLCPVHVEDIRRRDPDNAGKVCLSSNGINAERIQKARAEGLSRDPKRIIWSSSPDRGLEELLDVFERAREQVPDLALRCFYGMQNIEASCGGDSSLMPWRPVWRTYERALRTPGVEWHGRVSQPELYREFSQAGIWCYPTWFPETSCISCMEAQALGAIPITNPIWATGHNVGHGVFIQGETKELLTKARYVQAVVHLATNPEAQEAIRRGMMTDAVNRFDWERVVDQWEAWL